MDTLYERKAQSIKNIAEKKTTVYKSINKAKKESRKIQLKNGGIGCGSLVLVE